MPNRIQLSLYVPVALAHTIEALRQTLDPIQHALIPAHVTLLRDEEAALVDPATLTERLARGPLAPLILSFGAAVVFDGHGLLLPCTAGEPAFHHLRSELLGTAPQRRLQPHLTLAHPRNPKAPGNDLAATSSLPPELSIRFDGFHLISQSPGQAWQVLRSFPLSAV